MKEKFRSGQYGYQVQMDLYKQIIGYGSFDSYDDEILDEVCIPKDNLGFDMDKFITLFRQITPQPKPSVELVKKGITKFKL